MWGLGAAWMHVGAIFVSGIPGRDSTGDAGHKMRRYLALGDATETRFSPFLVRRSPNIIWGTRLEMLLYPVLAATHHSSLDVFRFIQKYTSIFFTMHVVSAP
jgi:hypothetical protein